MNKKAKKMLSALGMVCVCGTLISSNVLAEESNPMGIAKVVSGNDAVAEITESVEVTNDVENAEATNTTEIVETVETTDVTVVDETVETIEVLTEETAIFEYSVDSNGAAAITKYNGEEAVVSIPETLDGYKVTSIARDAFYGNTTMTSLVMPDTITSLAEYAVSTCSSLKTVQLSKGLTSIGYGAFLNCTSLETIEIPKSLVTVTTYYSDSNNGVFIGCTSLKEVTFEEGITQIHNKLFQSCPGLERVEIPATVTYIGEDAFKNCSNLTEVIMEDSTKNCTIGKEAFSNCPKLQTFKMTDGVTSIGYQAFYYCIELANVNLSKNLASIGYGAFLDCDSITSIEIPKSLNTVTTYYNDDYNGVFRACDNLKNVTFEAGTTKVCSNLFQNCSSIESISIPATVITIGEDAFKNCGNLSEVIMEDSSKNCTIEKEAFYNCTNLKTYKMTDGVTSIGIQAFCYCRNLATLNLSKSLTSIGYGAFLDCDSITSIVIPKSLSTVSTYYDDDYNGVFRACDNLKEVTFEAGATQIASNLFQNCTGIEEIEIPATVTTIGTEAFKGCGNLSEVIMVDSNKNCTIGEEAFYNCTNLQVFKMSDGVKSIGKYAFAYCRNLATLNLSKALTSVGYGVFYDCDGITSIEIPKSLTTVTTYYDDDYNGVFRACDNLREVTFEEGTTQVCSNLFQNCSGLERIEIPATVTTIGSEAFSKCDNLAEVILSEGLKVIGNRAFYYCGNLAEINFPNTLESIGVEAFDSCNFTAITIPDSVLSIGDLAFSGCTKIKEITLGSGLTVIQQYAFNDCSSLEKIVLPYRVTTIEKCAFAYCSSLTEIVIPRATTSIASDVFHSPTNLTIYGVMGTYAEAYAESVGATFVNTAVSATSIALNNTELVMDKGSTCILITSIAPADFTDEVTWFSTNTDVVTVTDTGVVTAKGVGTARIRVSAGSVSADCTVTVRRIVSNIELSSSNLQMNALEEVTLTLNISPEDAENKNVVWSSSDENIATVDQNGKITALKKGTAVITATAQDGGGASDSCNVTVANNAYICTDISQLESTHNYENACYDVWVYTDEDAKALCVTFDKQTMIEEDFDFLYIYNGEGRQVGKYTGSELAGQTVIILGNTVKIQIKSDAANAEWGFKVSELLADKANFADVQQGDWKYVPALYAYNNGIMTGKGNNDAGAVIFAPDDKLTRQEFAQIIYAAENKPAFTTEITFTDLMEGQWYVNAVLWAAENGIVSGVGEGKFGVDQNITREQLALMLYKYAQLKGYDTTDSVELNDFVDKDDVETWSETALKWAVANGVMSGKTAGNGVKLDPKGEASRAECAAMLRSFMRAFAE